MMSAATAGRGPACRSTAVAVLIVGILLVATACGNDDGRGGTATTQSPPSSVDPVAVAQDRVDTAEAGVSAAEKTLAAAREGFCGTAKDYVETLDRYGHVFTDATATVGDVQTLGADLVAPRDEVVTAAGTVQTANNDLAGAKQDLVDAQAALAGAVASASSVPSASTAPTTVTTPALLAGATIERVQQAEEDLARTARGINSQTAVIDAGAAYNSAALSLEVAWLNVLDEAQCISDTRRSEAVGQLKAYTTALQKDLQAAGYNPGPIDGVYGPQTTAAVQKLQTDSGLPATGFVDEATARALQDKLKAAGQQDIAQTAQLQTILTATGFWTASIDGQWTDDLTQALTKFQTSLGVEPTGEVDAATVAAFEQALAEAKATMASTPNASTVTAATTVTAPVMTATTTATATARTTAPGTSAPATS